MRESSNMTNEELFRLTGTLTRQRIEDLLDVEAEQYLFKGIEADVSEAVAQFPDEDAMAEPIKMLMAFMKTVRGNNKNRIGEIIEKLEDIQSTQNDATDDAKDQLKDYRN